MKLTINFQIQEGDSVISKEASVEVNPNEPFYNEFCKMESKDIADKLNNIISKIEWYKQ